MPTTNNLKTATINDVQSDCKLVITEEDPPDSKTAIPKKKTPDSKMVIAKEDLFDVQMKRAGGDLADFNMKSDSLTFPMSKTDNQCGFLTAVVSCEELSEEMLRNIARTVDAKIWKKLGLLLGLTWAELSHIQGDKIHNVTDAIFEVLFKWKSNSKRSDSESELQYILGTALAKVYKSSLKEFQVSDITDELSLYFIGEQVSSWKDLGYKLKRSQSRMECIALENPQNTADAAMQMLMEWKHDNAHVQDPYTKLLSALRDISDSTAVQISHDFTCCPSLQISASELQFETDLNGKRVELGAGASSVVLKGTYLLGTVAVKVIHQTTRLHDDASNRLRTEVQNMRDLHFENIVSLCGTYMDDEQHLYGIVMEYMSGGSLRDLLEKQILASNVKAKLLLDVCKGMYYLHKQLRVHRDLKASNVLLDANLTAKISDFGNARLADVTTTITKTIRATPTHMAPEAFRLSCKPQLASDVWSFGILMFEVWAEKRRHSESLYKRLPFPDTATLEQIQFSVGLQGQSPIQETQMGEKLQDDCPEVLLDLMQQCTQNTPKTRPTFGEILERFAANGLSKTEEVTDLMSKLNISELIKAWPDEPCKYQ